MLQDADALPQLIGDYKPIDQWQAHINELFYRLRGDQLRNYYQTFASADYRLAHALAADYYEKAMKREKTLGVKRDKSGDKTPDSRLTIHEWGCGNGNLAACFLTHLKALDKAEILYPRVRYVLVDAHQATLDMAKAHPDLRPHQDRIDRLCARAEHLESVADGSVDRVICNELWNDLPTKLLVKKAGEIEEEQMRPNLHEDKHAQIQDWSTFVRAFDAKEAEILKRFPPFFDDLIWEKEYQKVEWRDVPYRKTITEFLRQIDDEVLVPVNLGACATVKEAKRVLAPDAIGFSSFDAGTADMKVLNDPEKPCYGLFGGQYSFMINLALVEAVAKHLGIAAIAIENQREFIGRSLGTNVLTFTDLLSTHSMAGAKLQPWEQDRLAINTIRALNHTYDSLYRRQFEFPLRNDMPTEERETLETTLSSLKPTGVPDTAAYLTEDELLTAMNDLELVGYDREAILMALHAPPGPVDYQHWFCG